MCAITDLMMLLAKIVGPQKPITMAQFPWTVGMERHYIREEWKVSYVSGKLGKLCTRHSGDLNPWSILWVRFDTRINASLLKSEGLLGDSLLSWETRDLHRTLRIEAGDIKFLDNLI